VVVCVCKTRTGGLTPFSSIRLPRHLIKSTLILSSILRLCLRSSPLQIFSPKFSMNWYSCSVLPHTRFVSTRKRNYNKLWNIIYPSAFLFSSDMDRYNGSRVIVNSENISRSLSPFSLHWWWPKQRSASVKACLPTSPHSAVRICTYITFVVGSW
jgi:hypothetical protein